MTTQQESFKRLEAANETVSAQTFEDLDVQARKVAANILAQYGDRFVLNAQGFILSTQKIATATLLWLVAEGYATLTEKAAATRDELAERREAKLGKVDGPEGVADARSIGEYL